MNKFLKFFTSRIDKKHSDANTNAIHRKNEANNDNDDGKSITPKIQESVDFQERNAFTKSSLHHQATSNIDSFIESNITTEMFPLDTEYDTRYEDIITTDIENLATDNLTKKETKKKTKRRPDQLRHEPSHPVTRRPKPPKPSHEAAPLESLTNIAIRRQLKDGLRPNLDKTLRVCGCRSSVNRLHRTTQYQVNHMLGKRSAMDALQFEDYFNQKSVDRDPLPSFEDLLKVISSRKSFDSSQNTLPRSRNVSVNKKKQQTPDVMFETLYDIYKDAIHEMKATEKTIETNFAHLSPSPRPAKRRTSSSGTKLLTNSRLTSMAETKTADDFTDKDRRTEGLFTTISTVATTHSAFGGSRLSTCTSKGTNDMVNEEDEELGESTETEEMYMEQLEETHRNSQKAPLSVFALEIGRGETKDLERVLDRFWAIYESRSVNFNHSNFHDHSSARWQIFAKRVINRAVKRLKAQERCRKKYTEFLFPELKNVNECIPREAETYPTQMASSERNNRQYLPKRTSESDVDWIAKIQEAEEERRRIHKESKDESTLFSSSDEKLSHSIYDYAEAQFREIREKKKTFKVIKRIGQDLVLPVKEMS